MHPLCISELVQMHSGSQPASINLSACQKKYNGLSFTAESPWEASWSADQNSEGHINEDLPVFSAYKIAGGLDDDQVLLTHIANYGGSGTFTNAVIVKGLTLNLSGKMPSTLEVVEVFAGGDRCFGGIDDLLIQTPNRFIITRRITPAELINFGQGEKTPSTTLPDCALCCIGTISESYSLTGSSHLNRVTIFPQASFPRIPEGDSGAVSRCLYQLLPDINHRMELNKEELEALHMQFKRQCLNNGE